mmetsp:Transcript_11880/g.27923  ORF Transcript_11880/g.27923 Transcript_11880/m.27923 type:complete len:250 (+) Transcript_11880:533-1282(+)
MPATTERFSRMMTERPAALSRAAAMRPSRPAPMTTTSVCSGSGTGFRPITSRRLSKPAEPRTCAISRTMSSAAPSGDEAAPSASASKTRVSRREHDLSAARMAAVWAATSAAPLPTATSAMGASTAHLSAAAVCAACAAGGCDMSRPMMSMVEARRASAGCRCSHAAVSAEAAADLDFEQTRMAARKEVGVSPGPASGTGAFMSMSVAVARRAPSTSAWSLRHARSCVMATERAVEAKPQSVEAMTREG